MKMDCFLYYHKPDTLSRRHDPNPIRVEQICNSSMHSQLTPSHVRSTVVS